MFENQVHAPFSQRWALINLTVSIIILSIRYHTSVSFERPVHLTIIALVLTGLSLASIARWQPKCSHSLAVFQRQDPVRMHSFSQHTDARRTSGVLRHNSAALRLLFLLVDRARRLHPSFYLLVPCAAMRTWLQWATTRTSQCSRGGLESLLPFLTLVLEAVGPLGISPPDLQPHDFAIHQGSRPSRLSLPPKAHLLYAVSILAWPVLVVLALDRSDVATGTVCPVGGQGWEALVPHMQLVKCGLDALIVTHCAHLIRNAVDDEVDVLDFMAALSLTAGGCVLMLSLPGWLGDAELAALSSRLRGPDVRAVLLDGTLVASAVVCAINLLSVLHSSAFALFVTGVGFLALQAERLGATAYLSPSHFPLEAERSTLLVAAAAPLLYLTQHLPNVSKSLAHPSMHKWLVMAYIGVVSGGVVCCLWISVKAGPSDLELSVAVEKLVSDAEADAVRWEAQASRSRTLAEAAAEYERRHGILPPPNFDKWYLFASERNSSVIDDFGQIHDDLLPFWGQEPASIRAETARLLSRHGGAGVGVGGLRIRNGTVQPSAGIADAQAWMTETFQGMLGPFVQWLPDMDLALNLADDCRMAVPFRDMRRIRVKALRNRALAGSNKNQAKGYWGNGDGPAESPWAKDPAGQPTPEKDGGAAGSAMTRVRGEATLHDWVVATCPPKGNNARTSRWWDWALACADCSRPHSMETSSGPLVDNVQKALDPCHQPDLAYLDGIAPSPDGTLLLARRLLPLFSQARVGGFSDILIPSAWDFAEQDGQRDATAWGNKKNALLWRGPPRMDRATRSTRWAGSLEWRFVHEAHSSPTELGWASAPSPQHGILAAGVGVGVGVNVSFTGGEGLVQLCDGSLCQAQASESWGKTQPGVGIAEHWQYKHLMDLGEAGSRGQTLAFLQSESLPYRAVRLRTWYEERLQAWHHYVPVDVRLGRGFWAALGFLGSNGGGGGGDTGSSSRRHGSDGSVDVGGTAEKMARQGREWAGKALRREDMQIYMFRLLLEWGRIVDDERDRLGFAVPAGEVQA